jgi:RNA polymerase sigma-70 factor (ECF subfamily)
VFLINREEDIVLVEGCQRNNRKAQEQLYKQFYGVMHAICLRYTQHSEDALEVLQMGFLKVFKNIDRFQFNKASLYTWIRTIMVNTAIDFLRQRQHFQDIDATSQLNVPEVQSEALSRLSTIEILKLVQELPPATQTVFNLYVMDGYMHKEIADLLHISEGTSKWHLSEARRLLQKRIYSLNAKAV